MRVNTKFIIGLLLFALIACTNKKTSSHNSNNDSINKYLPLASSPKIPFAKKDFYNKKALCFVDLDKNDTLTRFYLRKISSNFYDTNNWKNYRKVVLHLLKNAIKAKDTSDIAVSYRSLGNYYFENQVLDSSFYYYIKAEKNYLEINDKENYSVILLKKGIVQNNVNDYLGAQLTLNRALNYFKATNNKDRLIALYISLGIVETELKDFGKAIKYFNLSLAEQNKSNSKTNEINKAFNYFNLGDVYFKLGNVKKALNYVELALDCERLKEKNSKLYCLALGSYAFYKMKLKDYNELPHLFNEVIRVSDSLNYFKGSFFTRIDLSEFYAIKKDTLKAQNYADEALKIARRSKVPYNILNGLRQVGVVNKNKASNAIDEYDKRIDSLLAKERKTRNQFYKIQLETDQITQEKENAIKQKWLYISAAAMVLVIVILLFVVYVLRTQKQKLFMRQSQQEANENIYKLMLNQQNSNEEARQKEKQRIALELHDNILNKLAGTRFNLFAISKNTEKETIDNALLHISKIREIEDEIRAVSHNLSENLFKQDNSYKELLEDLIVQQNLTHTTSFHLELDDDLNWEGIDATIKMNLYRIIQEAIYNTNKHANASSGVVSIIEDERNICLSVSDNGNGFDAQKAQNGIGHINMKQRIQSLNGAITISSGLGNGTIINCRIPIV